MLCRLERKSLTEFDCRAAVIATGLVVMVFLDAVIFTTTEEASASIPLLNFHFPLPVPSSPDQRHADKELPL